jgi:hypothetical protein
MNAGLALPVSVAIVLNSSLFKSVQRIRVFGDVMRGRGIPYFTGDEFTVSL